MKNIRKFLLAFVVCAAAVSLLSAKPIPGPKGGRILTTEAPHAEFFVAENRTVVVTFYDQELKPLTPGDHLVSAVAEARSGKVKIDFEKTASGFVSRQPLPEGDDFNVVVQIRDTAGGKPKNHRVLFHDEICPECKRAEYACICEHGGEAH